MSKQKLVYNISYSNSGGVGHVAAELNKGIIKYLGIQSRHLYFMSGNIFQLNINLLFLQISALLDKLIVSKHLSNNLFSFYRSKSKGKLEGVISSISDSTLIIHWFPGCLRYRKINNAIQHSNKVILVLHDCEIFTGGCHFTGDCRNYESGCSKCPQVRKSFHNGIKKNFNLKSTSFAQTNNLIIVSPSQWLTEKAKKSAMFSSATYVTIPNLISEDFLRNSQRSAPGKEFAGFRLGFIASNINDHRKGLKLLLTAIENHKLREVKLTLDVVGQKNIFKNVDTDRVCFRGNINDKTLLFDFLINLDLLVVPSYEDNFPSVILEAKALGVPVLARAVGGITDMIKDQVTGIIFKDDQDFFEKLSSTLNQNLLWELSANAKKNILQQNYNKEIMSKWNSIIQ